MAYYATRALLEEQDQMVKKIQEEIVEFTGSAIPFGFTENVFLINNRVWHEFKILDDTQLLMYAFLRLDGTVLTVNALDEARDNLNL
jgi:hypothetical protein